MSNIGCSNDILEILNIDERIISCLDKLSVYYDEKEVEQNFKRSKAIVFCMEKQYFESKVFKEQWENSLKLKKQVVKVVLQEQKSNFYEDCNYCLSCVFEIYKNYDETGFIIGFETERLIKKIEKILELKIVRKILKIYIFWLASLCLRAKRSKFCLF